MLRRRKLADFQRQWWAAEEEDMATELHDSTHSPTGLYQLQDDGSAAVDLADTGSENKILTAVGTPLLGPGHGSHRAWVNASERLELSIADSATYRTFGAISAYGVIIPKSLGSGTLLWTCTGDVNSDLEAENVLWSLRLGSTDGLQYLHENAGGVDSPLNNAGGLVAGLPTHVGFTRDSAGTGIKLYINGAQVGSLTASAASSGGTNAQLLLGEWNSGAAPYVGAMASVKIIVGTELTAAQMLTEAKRCLA